jgi:streptomycin 6-kinase
MLQPLPSKFKITITEVFGDRGREWLDQLPATIAFWAERWSLRIDPPFASLSYNFVAPAVRSDGTAAVLKLGVPNKELTSEIAALRLYDGRGISRLLEADADAGALLIERLQLGTPLERIADDEGATIIAARVMRQLWRPVSPDHPFPTVERWGSGFERLRSRFNGGTGPLPAPLVDRAERLFADLTRSQSAPVLLHGDLHHWNILQAEREPWLAIDPKGVVGEAAYEVGALLRNPRPQPTSVLARRLDILADELAIPRDRLAAWSFAQAVLSAWWGIEDHGRIEAKWIATAEQMAELTRG